MSKEDVIEAEGTVIEVLPSTVFKVNKRSSYFGIHFW